MKWLVAALAAAALLLSGFAVHKVKQLESASGPHVRLIANAP